jgi:hypothetical protein
MAHSGEKQHQLEGQLPPSATKYQQLHSSQRYGRGVDMKYS